eukprot:TRINITY_DN12103_c0_g1_i1.p1 TRINITY_DN12103_c0_g1~~TRINITY_DN12103_c0_g1_i1.p1  ORF type:complete len:774 (+),score=157.05 TRINITY_DN12103_c0_g1_i1:16-2337(+)
MSNPFAESSDEHIDTDIEDNHNPFTDSSNSIEEDDQMSQQDNNTNININTLLNGSHRIHHPFDSYDDTEGDKDYDYSMDEESIDMPLSHYDNAHSLEFLSNYSSSFRMDNLDYINQHLIEQFFEEPMMANALEQGVDLKEYHSELGQTLTSLCRENESLYEDLEEPYGDLYVQLDNTEVVLGKLESVLDRFGTRLSKLVTEITDIQQACSDGIVSLENRKAVEKNLTKYMNDIYIPKNLIKIIAKGKINLAYLEYLREFISKANYILEIPGNLQSSKRQKKTVHALAKKASDKIYEWMKKKVNAQIKSLEKLEKLQKPLAKYSLLFQFLVDYKGEYAVDIVDNYVNNVSGLYYSHISYYTKIMGKRMFQIASKNDLIGEDDNKIKSIFTSTIDVKNRTNIYSLALRETTLQYLENYVEFPQSTEKKSYEYLFRCVNYMLMNRVTEEMVFAKEFFIVDLSERLFGKTISLLEKNITTFIQESYDCIGMLILQCIVYTFKKIMQERNEYSLNQYWDNITRLLSDRFYFVFMKQIESIQNANPRNLGEVDIRTPHYVTRRYAEFSASILSLERDFPKALDHFNTIELLGEIRTTAMDHFLIRLSSLLDNERERYVLLINNYDLILSVAQERNIVSPETDSLDIHLRTYSTEYAKFEIEQKFKRLLTFTNKYSVENGGNVDVTKPDKSINYVEDIMKSFAENEYWKQSITEIYDTIMLTFSNFHNGMAVFGEVTRIIVNNYTTFLKIIQQFYPQLKVSQWFVSRKSLTYGIAEFEAF